MNKKIFIIIGIVVLVSVGIWRIIVFKNSYIYMPYEYEESEIFWLDWNELKTPMRLEICSDKIEDECIYSTDEEEIKFFIESYWGLEYTTRSRKEFENLNIDFTSNSQSNRYNVVLRVLDQDDEEEISGYILFYVDLYPGQDYAKGNSFYYYYRVPEELKEFVFNYNQ